MMHVGCRLMLLLLVSAITFSSLNSFSVADPTGSSCASQFSKLAEKYVGLKKLDLDQIANRSEKKSLSMLAAESSGIHRQTLVRNGDTEVFGKMEKVDLAADYPVFVITDGAGQIHLLDGKSTVDIFEISNPEDLQRLSRSKVSRPAKIQNDIDISRLKSYACPPLTVPSSETSKARSLVEQHMTNENRNRVLHGLAKTCKFTTPAIYASMPFWGVTSIVRAEGYGTDSYVLNHSSNFYFGLVTMGLFHSCIAEMNPNARTTLLLGATAANAGVNAFEEINIDGKQFGGGSPRTETDWEDFGAGVTASALYAVAAIGFEAAYKTKVGNACK